MYSYSATAIDVKGDISTKDTTQIKIIKVSPDDFPQVSVVFEAIKNGMPIFGISKDIIRVTENNYQCEVVSLNKISERYPISITLIIDHSASMQNDFTQLYDSITGMYKGIVMDSSGYVVVKPPVGYVSPLKNAKLAVVSFVKEFTRATNDSIQIIGFSTRVDIVSKFSNNISYLDSITNSISTDSATAFLDALSIALDELKERSGIKIIVALTDGLDNVSHITAKQVIRKSQRLKIPIYNIGLGGIDSIFLQQISNETNGAFYYTKQPKMLLNIYNEIQKRIKSIYDLRYNSVNLSSNDSVRKIKIEFVVDSIYLQSNLTKLNLPKETIKYLKAKERRKRQRTTWFIVIGIAVSTGILVYRFRRKRKR